MFSKLHQRQLILIGQAGSEIMSTIQYESRAVTNLQ